MSYRETLKVINHAAYLVRSGKAETVTEAYNIIEGKYRTEKPIYSPFNWVYAAGEYRDYIYARMLQSREISPSVVDFVKRTVMATKNPNSKESIY